MNNKLFSFYPKVSMDLMQSCKFKIYDVKGAYEIYGKSFPLNLVNIENTGSFIIEDENYEWTVEKGLRLNFSLSIENTQVFFGGTGVASPLSEVGIAIKWFSKKSSQRGAKRIVTFDSSTNSLNKDVTIEFKPNTLRGELVLEIIAFLHKYVPGSGCSHFANVEGTNFGVFERMEIILEGNGSSFPIVEVSKHNAPLWSIRYEVDDPRTDSFSKEYIALCLNKAHPLFEELGLNDKKVVNPFFKEVFAFGLYAMILKINEDLDGFDSSELENIEIGSVASAMKYYESVLGWNLKDPLQLVNDIHAFIDEEL